MTDVLSWARVRRDEMAGCWIFSCDLCGIRERYAKYWAASRVLEKHAAMHAATDLHSPRAN